MLYGLSDTPTRPPMTTPALPLRRITWLSWLLLVLGIGGFAALWVLLALSTDRQNSWMAVLGAVDIAVMLRLGGWPAGPRRALAGVLATVAIVLLTNWGIIASQLGADLGIAPWDSALRLGTHHAMTLAGLANGAGDAAWIALGLVVAALTAR